MKFQHFLITQFNLKHFWSSEDFDNHKWLEWTENRIVLFQKYCLPSVLNQKSKNFTWMIFVDRSTPQYIIDLLTTGDGSNSLIQWQFMDGYTDFKSNYMSCVLDATNPGVEWIITTNLDNDDALHECAIQTIQHNFTPIQDHLISLTNGYCLNVESNTLSQYYYPRSPFLSVIERTNVNLKGIHHVGHTEWENLKFNFYRELIRRIKRQENKEVTYVMHTPLWIQVVHGQNVSNSFYRGLPVLQPKNLEQFGIPENSSKLKWTSILKYKNYYLWKRYIFCYVLRLF